MTLRDELKAVVLDGMMSSRGLDKTASPIMKSLLRRALKKFKKFKGKLPTKRQMKKRWKSVSAGFSS